MSRFCKEVNLILEKLKAGDSTKQKELYELTCNHLKVIAIKYAADKNDYEDILVETYLRAFKYVDNINTIKDGYNWLCKIVQNVAIDINKKLKKSCPLEEIVIKSNKENFVDFIADKDLLLREINKFDEEDRQLLYLRFWRDYTIDKISKELNRPKSTLHKRLQSLLTKLNKNFNK